MMHSEHHMYGGWFMYGGWVRIILTFILLVIVVYFISKLLGRMKDGTRNEPSNHALDILNERFAKGEITEEEYKDKKEIIMGRS